MRRYLLILIALLHSCLLFAQNPVPGVKQQFNFGMEKFGSTSSLPDGWVKFSKNTGYTPTIDTIEKHGGKASLRVDNTGPTDQWPFASYVYVIPARYQGKEIELKAWMKIKDVTGFMGLMLRIDDADHNSVGFANLQDKRIKGTKDWAQYSVKLPLTKDAQTIFAGPILGQKGILWIDDVQVLIDGKDISQAPLRADYNPNPVLHPRYGSNTPASGRVRLKDVDLYYETYGSGQPLLLLHGNSGSIYAFSKQIPELSKKYKVIAVDTRAQGNSKDLSTGPLSYDLFADDMKQLLDSLHITKTDVLGWSDGGNTGLIMAYKYPGYINKLAIMGANMEPSGNAVDSKVLKEVQEELDALKADTSSAAAKKRRLTVMLLDEPHITFDDLKKITAPVLVMAGEHDVILEKHTKAIAAAIPNGTLHIFKGATHYAPVEIVDEFNKTVLEFLGK